MSATHACHREVVEVLLGKGGSIDLHTKNGKTALVSASENGYTAIAETL